MYAALRKWPSGMLFTAVTERWCSMEERCWDLQPCDAVMRASGLRLLLLLLLCAEPLSAQGLGGSQQPARTPLVPGKPFLVVWGIPDSACPGRPDPAAFGMEGSDQVAVFYEDSLGLYPYYSARDQPVSGGLPQHTRLDVHLQRVEADLNLALPSADFAGLAVLRWEEWAPQWGRNCAKQEIYQEESRALLRGFFPDWSPAEVDQWAKVDFEAAAQAILMETLREVKRLRPKALWGMAPYPNCYTSGPSQLWANFTGRCPTAETALNEELVWLWKRSSALYPSLQLDKAAGTSGARLYASNQVREALRVAAMTRSGCDLPVFPLVKSVYISSTAFLSQVDLVNTIGESAAVGAAGVIIWEKSLSTKTQRGCWELADFMREVLGPYVVNVTAASRLCGVVLCKGRGRCVRRIPESPAYLHLPPASFLLLPNEGGGIQAEGDLAPSDLEAWRKDFQCQWYEGLEGAAADEQSPAGGAQEPDWGTPTSTGQTEETGYTANTAGTTGAPQEPSAGVPWNNSSPSLPSPIFILLLPTSVWLTC